MKKTFVVLNGILMAVAMAFCVYYEAEGGLKLKAITCSWFAVLGIVNLVYAFASKGTHRSYPASMALGLIVCMIGDVVLNISFIPGALIFAVGHLLYLSAFCFLKNLPSGT